MPGTPAPASSSAPATAKAHATANTPKNAASGPHAATGPSTPPAAAAPATPVADGDATGARTARAAEVITDARSRIDALDDRIIGLVKERMAVSARIQESRIASGGRRVNLSREMEILGSYRDALGRPGTSLAMTLLELCRGRI